MRRKCNNKLSAIIIGVIAIFCVLSAHAQNLKTILLKPTGWICEWNNSTTGNSGRSDIVFEDSGEKVVAKIHIVIPGQTTTGTLACERDVIISADTVKFDGCRDQNVVLIFDPNDKVYPFKTKTQTVNGYDWKVKAK